MAIQCPAAMSCQYLYLRTYTCCNSPGKTHVLRCKIGPRLFHLNLLTNSHQYSTLYNPYSAFVAMNTISPLTTAAPWSSFVISQFSARSDSAIVSFLTPCYRSLEIDIWPIDFYSGNPDDLEEPSRSFTYCRLMWKACQLLSAAFSAI